MSDKTSFWRARMGAALFNARRRIVEAWRGDGYHERRFVLKWAPGPTEWRTCPNGCGREGNFLKTDPQPCSVCRGVCTPEQWAELTGEP